MGRIAPLSEDLRNKISAGEVVERPASVIKELIENSIDSGADLIDVVVERGGTQLMLVSDNGQGIAKDDLSVCFQRYTTSKIHTVDDLFQIGTLGFRGEALASIASVAQSQVITAIDDSGQAWSVNITDGVMGELHPAAGSRGSQFRVENLFYNTPARRKFLKSPKIELRHIVEIVKRFALSYPQIRFSLIADEKPILQLEPGTLAERIVQVYDPSYGNGLLPIDVRKGDYYFTGYIGNLDLVRSRPANQYLFLNRRFIRDRLLNSAVYSGFQSLVKRGEYPFFIIEMTIPMDQVDVNVHPMKTEVRFRDEWRVYHVLKSGVEEALGGILETLPSFTPQEKRPSNQLQFTSGPQRPVTGPRFRLESEFTGPLENKKPGRDAHTGGMQNHEDLQRAKSYASALAERRPTTTGVDTDNIWQVHNKYIFSQIESGLVIIDQHVAHERILYEEALNALETNPLASQALLFPETLDFSVEDHSVLLDLIPYLKKIGFQLRAGAGRTVIVEAVPADISWGREKQVLIDIIDHYIAHQQEYASYRENLAASFACHAAIKAGDSLTMTEMQALVNRLFATRHPYYCPHGRPIIVQMSLEELDERFERS